MKSFKTELFKVSFDQNDISKIVHIEHIKSENYISCLELEHVVSYVKETLPYQLSKKEAVKIITKASEWML